MGVDERPISQKNRLVLESNCAFSDHLTGHGDADHFHGGTVVAFTGHGDVGVDSSRSVFAEISGRHDIDQNEAVNAHILSSRVFALTE